jgi:hypothetical protein
MRFTNVLNDLQQRVSFEQNVIDTVLEGDFSWSRWENVESEHAEPSTSGPKLFLEAVEWNRWFRIDN